MCAIEEQERAEDTKKIEDWRVDSLDRVYDVLAHNGFSTRALPATDVTTNIRSRTSDTKPAHLTFARTTEAYGFLRV